MKKAIIISLLLVLTLGLTAQSLHESKTKATMVQVGIEDYLPGSSLIGDYIVKGGFVYLKLQVSSSTTLSTVKRAVQKGLFDAWPGSFKIEINWFEVQTGLYQIQFRDSNGKNLYSVAFSSTQNLVLIQVDY